VQIKDLKRRFGPALRAGGGIARRLGPAAEREFFITNLLVRIHVIIVMIEWTGLAPWEFEFPFSGSLTSTFLCPRHACQALRIRGSVFRVKGQGCGFHGLGVRVQGLRFRVYGSGFVV